MCVTASVDPYGTSRSIVSVPITPVPPGSHEPPIPNHGRPSTGPLNASARCATRHSSWNSHCGFVLGKPLPTSARNSTRGADGRRSTRWTVAAGRITFDHSGRPSGT